MAKEFKIGDEIIPKNNDIIASIKKKGLKIWDSYWGIGKRKDHSEDMAKLDEQLEVLKKDEEFYKKKNEINLKKQEIEKLKTGNTKQPTYLAEIPDYINSFGGKEKGKSIIDKLPEFDLNL